MTFCLISLHVIRIMGVGSGLEGLREVGWAYVSRGSPDNLQLVPCQVLAHFLWSHWVVL